MGYAWIDAYWFTYTVGGTPRISFTAGSSSNPWLNVTDNVNLEAIRHQLNREFVWISWNDTTREVRTVITYQPK